MSITVDTLNEIYHKPPVELGWWLEVFTARPLGVRYFGAFESRPAAEEARVGCIASLKKDSIVVISMQIKRCQPKQLAILANELTASDLELFPPGIEFAGASSKTWLLRHGLEREMTFS